MLDVPHKRGVPVATIRSRTIFPGGHPWHALRRRVLSIVCAVAFSIPLFGIASVAIGAPSASAASCSIYLDCSDPTTGPAFNTFCNFNDTYIPTVGYVYFNGSYEARVNMRYNPDCRSVWSREDALVQSYPFYYSWADRLPGSGPPGDTFGTNNDYNNATNWIFSHQVNDAGYQSYAWGGYNNYNFIFPSGGSLSAYGNTNPY